MLMLYLSWSSMQETVKTRQPVDFPIIMSGNIEPFKVILSCISGLSSIGCFVFKISPWKFHCICTCNECFGAPVKQSFDAPGLSLLPGTQLSELVRSHSSSENCWKPNFHPQ